MADSTVPFLNTDSPSDSASKSRAAVADAWKAFTTSPGDTEREPMSSEEASGSSTPSEVDAAPTKSASAAEQSESSDSADSKDIPTSSDVEEIILTDESGKRKIKWDFADREKTKKAVLLAAGARKWQAERDTYKGQVESTSKELGEYKNVWNAVEKSYQENGIEGLVNLLAGKPDAYKQWEEARYEQINRRRSASPSELRQIELEEKAETEAKRAESFKREHETLLNSLKTEREAADKASLEGLVHPVFFKYSFSGKLGDEQAEEMYNTMVWNNAMSRLEAYPEGTRLTQDLVDKEFRTVSSTLRKHIDKQADTKVKSAIETKKAVAADKVALKASQGMTRSSAEDEIRNSVRKGTLGDSLRAFLSGQKR